VLLNRVCLYQRSSFVMSQELKVARSSLTRVYKMRPSRYVISTRDGVLGACAGSRLPQPIQLDMFSTRLESDIPQPSLRSRTRKTASGAGSTSATTAGVSAIEQRKRALLSAISGSSS